MTTGMEGSHYAPRTGHVVELYDDPSTLEASVAAFVGFGLRQDDTAIVIATRAHWVGFRARLLAQGHAVDAALEQGKLTLLDAHEALEQLTVAGVASEPEFNRLAAGLLDGPRGGARSVRIYGEMVDVLCRVGRPEAALELEQLWSRLGRKRPFSLFCGYGMDSLVGTDERLFSGICAEHSRVVFPAAKPEPEPEHARLRSISASATRTREIESFRLLVDSVKDYAIYQLDPHGVVASWNAGAERIKGYSAQEIIGSHFSRFYTSAEVLAGKCEMELEVAAREGRFEDEGYRIRKDGTSFWANVVITALRDDTGTLVGYGKVTRDLTERRRAEQERLLLAEAQEANRVKDEFLATISHELRTPLNSILGWATLLGERVTNGYVKRGIETIRRNSEAQSRIIEDVLDVARIASGKLSIEARPTDLAAIVRGVVEEMRPAIEAKALTLTCSLHEPIPLWGDPTRLQQVAWNLLSNALKFTPRGGSVVVELAVRDGRAILGVTDTGYGIEPAFMPHVFERFRQGDGSSARRHGGLGLGLSIVRHLVELHGGTITVESPGRDRGASFTVSLPLGAELGAGEAESAFQPPPRPGAGGIFSRLEGVHVLFVEDEPDARELVGELLASRGASVALASSASEAYAYLAGHLPDVIVSDIGMPDEDGYQFARRLRTLPSERGGGTPIVALTAYASAQDRRRAVEAGYNHHLAKPVDADELVRVLERLARRAPS